MSMSGSAKNELNFNLEEFLPISSKAKALSTTLSYSTCTHSHSGIALLGLNGNESEKNKTREFSDQPLTGSSRWNPTPEQLLALEEMYRRGTRTPSAEQIQQIATQLRRFGKIEGKNVFYWFQNHKARERQKRRREMEAHQKLRKLDHMRSLDEEVSGLKRTIHELEQKNLSVHPSNCGDQHLEGPSLSTYRRSYLEERELHRQKCASPEKNHTWHHAMDSYPLINNVDTTSSRFLNIQRQNSWSKPKNIDVEEVETLELFPLNCNSSEEYPNQMNSSKERKVPIRAITTKLNPNQYIEFLPLKD